MLLEMDDAIRDTDVRLNEDRAQLYRLIDALRMTLSSTHPQYERAEPSIELAEVLIKDNSSLIEAIEADVVVISNEIEKFTNRVQHLGQETDKMIELLDDRDVARVITSLMREMQ